MYLCIPCLHLNKVVFFPIKKKIPLNFNVITGYQKQILVGICANSLVNCLSFFSQDKGITVFQKKENRGQEVQKRIMLQDSATAQEVLKALDEACTSHQQHTLVRQKSEKFIKQFSN
ncbi:hypothetical protein AB205_0116830 [Aquarana catesbeiana]|uniref:Uncharacterized protein n=1 Tax=Aquarana catesbeiana TaxID=8400 RepID=A0A2G9S2P5_AQUCT|nr:hypothetical protein AB205_0116830 [Aquarana catesbeiana]